MISEAISDLMFAPKQFLPIFLTMEKTKAMDMSIRICLNSQEACNLVAFSPTRLAYS